MFIILHNGSQESTTFSQALPWTIWNQLCGPSFKRSAMTTCHKAPARGPSHAGTVMYRRPPESTQNPFFPPHHMHWLPISRGSHTLSNLETHMFPSMLMSLARPAAGLGCHSFYFPPPQQLSSGGNIQRQAEVSVSDLSRGC